MNKLLSLIFLLNAASLMGSAPATVSTIAAARDKANKEENDAIAAHQSVEMLWLKIENSVLPAVKKVSDGIKDCVPQATGFILPIQLYPIIMQYAWPDIEAIYNYVMTNDVKNEIKALGKNMCGSELPFHHNKTTGAALLEQFQKRFSAFQQWPHSSKLLKLFQKYGFRRSWSCCCADMMCWNDPTLNSNIMIMNLREWMHPEDYQRKPETFNTEVPENSADQFVHYLRQLERYAKNEYFWRTAKGLLPWARVRLQCAKFRADPEAFIANDKQENPHLTHLWLTYDQALNATRVPSQSTAAHSNQ